MSETITLTNQSELGPLSASFAADKGMNLISYKLGRIEVMAQQTLPLFHERAAGLGALIGPHFHTAKNPIIPENLDLMPHIRKGLNSGRKDPFSHGIARYVPWKVKHSSTQINAQLSGDDEYKSVKLKTLEGQNFIMHLDVRLLASGLFIKYSIESEKPSCIGMHYYYSLPSPGFLRMQAEPFYREKGEKKYFDPQLMKKGLLTLPVGGAIDISTFLIKDEDHIHDYRAQLITKDYDLHLHYSPEFEKQTCMQVYSDGKNPFVCLEPISALDPQNPCLKRSILELKLEIFPSTLKKTTP